MITAERLRELLHYNKETGVFTRLVRANNMRVGGVAGSPGNHGYRRAMLDGCSYHTHRLAWLWVTGVWPEHEIDHINMDGSDNRWVNLRAATSSQNKMNVPANSRNISWFKGVSWINCRRKWVAMIRDNGKKINLGYFDQPWRAYAAYCLAARKYHGEFARVYEPDQLIIPRKVFERRVLLNLLAATQPAYEAAA